MNCHMLLPLESKQLKTIVPQLTKEYAQRFFMDENVQYLFLAFYWYSNAPIFFTLIPFATFSTFHTLSYLRTSIIPTLFPVVSVQAASSAPAPSGFSAQISQFIKQWTDHNYGPAMQFVSYVEVVGVMGRLLLGAITFQTSFLAPLVYAHFLRLRYFMSSYTRAAFLDVSARLDKVLLPPSADARIPPMVGKAYTIIKSLVVRYGQSAVQQQPGTR
ncbi:hypothetical protein BC937DRAFT_90299 [Endogone sp. FLAS-F59071]|nr:hypothetical protein BC937DRAFT_90299 [Endogone sp. FLAS-F59071]|eukprot:RUS17177.1 hypothetical protein BC937DRAFT_90299 [Endogone sp. FLAS-F59071]